MTCAGTTKSELPHHRAAPCRSGPRRSPGLFEHSSEADDPQRCDATSPARRVQAIQSDAAGRSRPSPRSSVIQRINDYQFTTSSAVEEQTATAANITGVASAAAVTTEGVTQTQQAAGELNRMSAELQSLVDQFKV